MRKNAFGMTLAVMLAGAVASSSALAGPTVRASVDIMGEESMEGVLVQTAVSGNGRFMVFATEAPLVAEDDNGLTDIYVRDLESGTTMLVSVSVSGAGERANGASSNPGISGDGRRIAFVSSADNLVDDDGNGLADTFVRDLDAGITLRVNISSSGAEADVASPTTTPIVSQDGRYILFRSGANTLVAQTNWGDTQVFLHDLDARTTEMVSLSNFDIAAFGSSQSPGGVSADGRWVVFTSNATNLHPDTANNSVHVYLRDRFAGHTTLVSVNGDGPVSGGGASISDDGRYIAYSTLTDVVATDDNHRLDTYVWDNNIAHTITRATIGTDGQESEEDCIEGRISGDGRHVVFASKASEFSQTFVENTYQVFVRDLDEQTTSLVSKSTQGSIGLGHSRGATISADGRFVGFYSEASNLVNDDGNGARDAFVHDRGAASPVCPGDLDGDGLVGFGDLNTLLASYNSSAADPNYNPTADIDADGDVDFADLNVVVSAFNTDC